LIYEKVKKTIERYNMLQPGKTVIIGLSGGADSMALLTILNSLKDIHGIRLIAAHINHGVRGEEAQRDEDFCRDYCEKIGIELKVLHADAPGLANAMGISVEMAGRKLRYDFFESIAKGVDSPVVATAHNANDAVETMLYNLARGATLKGLSGIPPVRNLTSDLLVVRPLIDCLRDEILSLNIPFVVDSTNLSNEYTRNKIRNEILPLFTDINEGAIENISRCISSLRDDSSFLESLAEKLIEKAKKPDYFDVKILAAEDPVVLSRALVKIIFDKCDVFPEKVHIEKLMEFVYAYDSLKSAEILDETVNLSNQIQVPSGLIVRVENGKLIFAEKAEEIRPFSLEFKVPVKEFKYPFGTITASLEINEEFGKALFKNSLNYDKINSNLTLRNKRDGDKFRPAFRNLTKSLKNLFNEAKIPVADRAKLVLLEMNGEIIWIEGFGSAEGFEVKSGTKQVLKLEIN